MSTSITWPVIGGSSYSVPAAGEVNWPSLSNFLIALGAGAQSTVSQKIALRKATTTPVTVAAASDCVIVCQLSVPSAVTVNLPAGVAGQYFVVIDGTGDALTRNITINPNGAETIKGSASLVLNENRESVLLVYSSTDTDWKVFGPVPGAGSIVTPSSVTTFTNKTINGPDNTLTNISLTASVAGVLPIANGGTNASVANTGLNNLLPSQATNSDKFLKSDGTDTSWSLVSLTASVSGTLPIANGGTGQTTANPALNALLPSQTGNASKVLGTDGSDTSWVSALTNPMTTLGDIIYESAVPAPTRLAGNITSTKKFLTQTGTGSISAVPGWNVIVAGDLPAATSTVQGAVVARKTYVVGTAYVNGTPTIANNASFGTVTNIRSILEPYQTVDGTWKLIFDITFTSANSVTNGQLDISGVVFKNVANYKQAFTVIAPSGPNVAAGQTVVNSSTIYMQTSSGSANAWSASGNVELDSKPTWAD